MEGRCRYKGGMEGGSYGGGVVGKGISYAYYI